MIGSTLAHYRITAELGAGGMGEVWKAEDTKLGREVALKVLPEEFAKDPERMARFEREAKVLASLNHPNIATLYGLESAPVIPSEAPGRVEGSPEARSQDSSQRAPGNSGGPSTPASQDDAVAQDDRKAVTFIAMELVDGEDLSERIKRGPVQVDEAIPIALQIANALEAAHEQGIVHRDLKPANIKITEDGTVKVLDFGLAKAWESEGSDSSISMSPTLTAHATAAGVVLGTAAYMSPEQARGKKVDRRADVWSFGVVLWEMLTGPRLFEGETVTDVLAAVLRAEIPWEDLPSSVSPSVERLLRRCLVRDPGSRLRDMGDAALELREPPETRLQVSGKTGTSVRPGMLLMAAIAGPVIGLLVTAAVVSGWFGSGDSIDPARVVSHLKAPEGYSFDLNSGPPVISPNGDRIAFLASREDEPPMVFVRSLNRLEARRLDDTVGALTPFWSPDGKKLGFFADGKLKKVDADGGRAETLAEAQEPVGGFWAEDDTIIFVPHYHSPPRLIDAGGGQVRQLPGIFEGLFDPWYAWPRLLPGGRSYIVALQDLGGPRSGLYVVPVDGKGEAVRLSRTMSRADFIAPDRLLFWEAGALRSYPFDLEKLQLGTEGVRVADVGWSPYQVSGKFAVSSGGLLVYQPGTGVIGDTELVIVDRSGRDFSVVASVAEYYSPRISHDGRRVAVDITDLQVTQGDIWVFDLDRGTRALLAGSPIDESDPLWITDDSELIYRRVPDLFIRDVAGAKPERAVLMSDVSKQSEDISPDGQTLLFEVEVGDDADLWVLDLETGAADPWLDNVFREHEGRFSPDGRWVAYASEESGMSEVYLRSFPDADRRIVVSSGGGGSPVWRGDGTELFYYSAASDIVAVPVVWAEDGPRLGRGQPLFRVRLREADHEFDVFPDGERFLLNRVVPETDVDSLILVQNAFVPERPE